MSSDDTPLSKRERQKQRRQEKLAQEASAARAARGRRLLATGLVVGVIVAVVVFFGVSWWTGRQADRAAIAEAAARQNELGCTDIESIADEGRGHLDGSQYAANPPQTLYANRPATSGQHSSGVVSSGVFDKVIDERLTLHNLEHGYVTFWYDEDAPADEVERLKTFAGEQIEDGHPKVIVAQYFEPLPDNVNFSTVAWGFRQDCEQFEEGTAFAFLTENEGLAGIAPEKNLPVHMGGGQGVLDPTEEEGPILLPPLDAAAGAGASEVPAAEAPAEAATP